MLVTPVSRDMSSLRELHLRNNVVWPNSGIRNLTSLHLHALILHYTGNIPFLFEMLRNNQMLEKISLAHWPVPAGWLPPVLPISAYRDGQGHPFSPVTLPRLQKLAISAFPPVIVCELLRLLYIPPTADLAILAEPNVRYPTPEVWLMISPRSTIAQPMIFRIEELRMWEHTTGPGVSLMLKDTSKDTPSILFSSKSLPRPCSHWLFQETARFRYLVSLRIQRAAITRESGLKAMFEESRNWRILLGELKELKVIHLVNLEPTPVLTALSYEGEFPSMGAGDGDGAGDGVGGDLHLPDDLTFFLWRNLFKANTRVFMACEAHKLECTNPSTCLQTHTHAVEVVPLTWRNAPGHAKISYGCKPAKVDQTHTCTCTAERELREARIRSKSQVVALRRCYIDTVIVRGEVEVPIPKEPSRLAAAWLKRWRDEEMLRLSDDPDDYLD